MSTRRSPRRALRGLVRTGLAAVAASVCATALVSTAAPAQAVEGELVALGDSYSSGLGTRDYVDDGACKRSNQAFGPRAASALGAPLDFQACSGAVIDDVLANQVGALGTDTAYVTLTVGGNDAGFADVVTECALPAWASNCESAVNGARAYITGTLPGRLDGLYAEVASRAPSASVAVGTYPRLFNGEDCDLATFFSPSDIELLNGTADLLAGVIADSAATQGFGVADIRGAFEDHQICDPQPFINGFSNPLDEGYHPNAAGHGAYTDAVLSVL